MAGTGSATPRRAPPGDPGPRRPTEVEADGVHQLRDHPGAPRREHAVRAREGGVHGRDAAAQGAVRVSERGDGVPRRGGGAAARRAGGAPARARDRAVLPRRVDPRDRGRRARGGRDAPEPRGDVRGRAVPGGPVFPARRHDAGDPAAPGAGRRDRGARSELHREGQPGERARGAADAPSSAGEAGSRSATPSPGGSAREQVQRHEASIIREALAAAGGIQAEAARRLGMSRRTLVRKISELGLRRDP